MSPLCFLSGRSVIVCFKDSFCREVRAACCEVIILTFCTRYAGRNGIHCQDQKTTCLIFYKTVVFCICCKPVAVCLSDDVSIDLPTERSFHRRRSEVHHRLQRHQGCLLLYTCQRQPGTLSGPGYRLRFPLPGLRSRYRLLSGILPGSSFASTKMNSSPFSSTFFCAAAPSSMNQVWSPAL